MKRYYVCKVYGNGDLDAPNTPTTGAYRPALADIIDPATGMKAFGFTAQISPGQHPWCLVIAGGNKHGLVNNHPDIDPLPAYAMDVRLSAMHTPTKVMMMNKLSARGIDTGQFANADGFRDIVRALGKAHGAAFNEDDFDTTDE